MSFAEELPLSAWDPPVSIQVTPREPCPECGRPLRASQPLGLCPHCALNDLADGLGSPSGLAERRDSFRPGLGFGDYELLEEVGAGGMGVVYRARQRSLRRLVAIKVLHIRPQADPNLVRRFRAEAVAAGSLSHPHIVTIHDVGIHEGQSFLAMDFVPGESLAAMARDAAVSPRQVAVWMKAIAEAIEHAHERGILHRDLKPSNVMIDASGQPRILDFGLARRFDEDSSLTLSGQVVGSPNYMAPEQAAGGRNGVRRTTDVYGLGAILYHLLTGRPPSQGASIMETLQQVLHGDPPAPGLIRPGVPSELETICLKCLSREPERRYATAQQVADDLGRYLDDVPIHARPVSGAETAWRWCRRKPALAVSLGLALTLLLTLSVGGPLVGIRIRQQQRVSEENLYAADINVASHRVREGNLRAAGESLARIASSPWQRDLRGWEWRYLMDRCRGQQMAVLRGHTTFVASVAFAPTDSRLASIDEGGRLILWDWRETRLVADWIAHVPGEHHDARPWNRRHDAVFSPDGRWLATGGGDGWVRVWDVGTQREVFALPTPARGVASLQFSGDGRRLLTAAVNAELALWDLQGPQGPLPLARWHADTTWIFRAFFSRQGSEVIAVGNRSISTWSLADPGRPSRVTDWTEFSDAIVASLDQERVASYSFESERLKLWEPSHSGPAKEFEAAKSTIACLAFAPGGQRLASGGFDGCLGIWDIGLGTEQVRLSGHQGEIRSVAWSLQHEVVASGGTDGTIRVWNVEPASFRQPELKHGSKVQSLRFLAQGTSLLSVGPGSLSDAGHSVVRLWDVASGKLTASHTLTGRPIHNALGLNASGNQVTVADIIQSKGMIADRLRILGLPSLGWVAEMEGQAAAFTMEGSGLVLARDRRLFLRKDLEVPPTLLGIADSLISKLAVSPQGRMAAIRTEIRPRDIQFIELAPGNAPIPCVGHEDAIEELQFSPDGRYLATGSWDQTVGLWDVRSRSLVRRLRGHRGSVNCVAFSTDGRTLASGADDGTVRLWDLRTLRELAVLDAQPAGVWAIAFSPDGRRVAAGSWNGTVRFWYAPWFEEAASPSPVQ